METRLPYVEPCITEYVIDRNVELVIMSTEDKKGENSASGSGKIVLPDPDENLSNCKSFACSRIFGDKIFD